MFRHCTMDELLELRDGRGADAARRHVAECEACGAEVDRVHQRRAALKALPSVPPARDRWPVIRERILAERRRRQWRRLGGAGVAAAALLALVLGVGRVVPAPREAGAQVSSLDSLMRWSGQLDETLRMVSGERRVMDGLTALTIAELEDRVAAVDSAILRVGSGELATPELRDLWRERVSLMEALVTSHVQRVAYVGF